MAAAATGSGSITSRIKNLLRSPPAINLRRSRATAKAGTERITLDKVIGITASSSSSLACDLTTGVVAYPAGCVVVLCNPKKNKQTHILNASRKAVSALAFSPDGKYLVTGESGHMPAVRVWDVSDKVQVAELQCHKYGVSCVSFSPNLKYIVSVGYQHDKLVNVWDWKKNSIVASNKVSSKVTAVSFSEDSSFFVTTGNRHVKFWYLNESKACKANITVPLIGRSALLGELHNNIFSGVACGKGKMAGSIFCITSSGLLCQFNGKRLLDKWLDLKTSAANCISATEDFIFCGCANGTLKLFNPVNLQFVTNLPKPHYLGVDVAAGIEPSHLVCKKTDALYPDTIAVAFDPSNRWLSCVYSDHSLYVWDTKDVKKFGKVYSALYHSSSVWSVEVYPELENSSQAWQPSASFLTCSSDNTIRLWNVDAASGFQFTSFNKNIYSMDLIKVVYVGDNIQYLQDTTSNPDRTENGGPSDIKSGIRVITISPDGQHLASGDRMGTLRIFDLQFLDELMKVEAHDSEILCLEYSKPETGMNLLATASRDRLIHILNVDKQYSLVQTLDDHSSSITAVKFAANDNVKMVSCGVDKSIYFRTAQKSVDGIQFTRTHHVVGKTSLYDMDIDIMRKYVAIGCQDRNIRVFTIGSGKQKKCFKGSQSEDGILLKVQMDPSGTFVATSCSDKNISIFDFYTGECVASMFGHSEIVTGMKFTNDCKYLITVSGDSCIFIWRLDTQLTNCMRHRLSEIKQIAKKDKTPPTKTSAPIRRETFMVQKVASEDQEDDTSEDDVEDVSFQTPLKEPMDQDKTEDAVFLMTNGKLPLWAKRLEAGDGCVQDRPGNSTVEAFQPRGRWAERMDKDLIHSILGRKQLEEYCATPTPGSLSIAQGLLSSHFKEQDKFGPRNLDSFLEMMELSPSLLTKESMGRPSSVCLEDADSTFSREVDTLEMELSAPMFYPMQNEHSTSTENVYQVKEPPKKVLESESEWEIVRSVENSPDSAYSMDSGSNEQQQDDSDSVGQLSSDGQSSGLEEEEEQCCAVPQESHAVKTPDQEKFLKHNFETLANEFSNEKFDGTLNDLQPNAENESNFFLNPRLSISARFLSRCQKNSRMAAAFPPKVQQKLQHLPDASCKSLQLGAEINPFIDSHGSELESSFDGTKHLRNEEMNQTVEREYIRSEWDIESMSSSAEKSLALEVKDTAPNNGRSPLCKRSASVIDLVQGEEQASSDSFIAAAQSSLQNVHVSEETKQRHSLCIKMDMLAATLSKEMSKNKLAKSRSYMHPTASFKAKMSRSVSMGENLHLKALGQSRGTSLPNSRAVSTIDLTESMKGSTPSEDNPHENFKEKNPPKETLQTLSYGNHQARANLTLDLSKIHTDRLLMPPPIANGFAVTKVKQKLRAGQDSTRLSTSAVTPTQPASLAKTDQNVCEKYEENGSIPNMNSFTILKKATGNLEHYNSSPDGTEHTLEKFHSCNSIPLQPQHDSISPNRDAVSSNSNTIPEGNGFQKDVAASLRGSMGIEEKPINEADLAVSVENCEYVVTELQDTLQKALQLYNKVLSSEGTPELKSKMMAILCDAFSSARKHLNSIDCLPISLFASETPENGKVTALLEHYSEMLIKMVAQNLQLQH